MDHAKQIAAELGVRPAQVAATVDLLDAGNTLPFVARYRKEATGSLDETQLRKVAERLQTLRNLDERRETILATIVEQGKLTDQLRDQIMAAPTLTALEDLYQPYRPKRRTRASMARDKGLEPLAHLITRQVRTSETIPDLVAPYLSEDVPTAEEALAGARDIVAEMVSDHPEVRGLTREKAMQWGILRAQRIEGAKDEQAVYRLYYDFEGNVSRLRPHQVLAINRGESEKVLRVGVEIAERDWLLAARSVFRPHFRSPLSGELQAAIEDGAQRLLIPAMERDVRRSLTEQAEEHAIDVFATNLRNLLGQPPLAGHTVLGIDPGYRTGCKAAVVDPTGRVMGTTTIYPHLPQRQRNQALKQLATLTHRLDVTLVAIGNGTASRETEVLVAELIQMFERTIQYLIVSEAGASVYSASDLARNELPELDVTLRGAVSIARRVLDPLAELVKIDPKAIGVGMYQHDVNQKRLAETLDWVVESVVNQVGVDVNTASPALLQRVSGIGPRLAENIVAHRNEHGPFPNREGLLNVTGLGPKAFEQAAGFLRIQGGENPLDASAIHPESYDTALALLETAGIDPQSQPEERAEPLARLHEEISMPELAAQLKTGVPTLEDVFEQLVRPGRDPREDAPPPMLRSDILSMEDLRPGMRLHGTVRNVVDFGAFIDIGVKQDGLLHRSKKPRGEMLAVGDVIEVTVIQVELERGRISLAWPGME